MKSFATLLLLVASASAAKTNLDLARYTFAEYAKDFHKSYGSDAERAAHEKIFEANLARIVAHNARGLGWKEGVNEFTDYTRDQLKAKKGIDRSMMHSRRAARAGRKPLPAAAAKQPRGQLPASVDWRDQGVVTPIKDQGHCGSCWTFAATEVLESHVAIYTGTLFTLSEQQFVSCVENPDQCGGTGGCSGATMELAYDYAMENGLVTEWTAPYTSYNGVDGECLLTPEAPVRSAGITGYEVVESNSYDALMDVLANVGPVAITVDASQWSAYAGGIFDGCNQESPELDHGVQLVGYGSEGGQDYWLVRNSWGPVWGEHGYIRLARTADEAGRCGVDVVPEDGVGCKDGPANVTVCGTCGILFDNVYPTGAFLA